jgi:hypothetical protein
MIETKDITKMVQHIIRRDKGIADTQIMHPTREWFTGLGIAFLMVVLGSWFCYYLYTFYVNEIKKEVVIVEQAVPYQAATVTSALELFSARQKKYNEIIGGGVSIAEMPVVPATTTPISVTATTTEDVPELIIDPAPVFEDSEVSTQAVPAL